jgi:hypothetical protein
MSSKLLALQDVKIDRINKDGSVSTLPLTASPYYRALVLEGEEGQVIYEDYTNRLNEAFPEEPMGLDWRGFMELKASMAEGLKQEGDPIRIVRNLVFDGQHRLAILLFLNGPKQLLQIEDDVVTGLW